MTDPELSRTPSPARAGRWWLLVLVAGALLQVWLWQRAVWVYRDQVELYTLGLDLLSGEGLAPFGKLMTGDYPLPGSLLQLLIGAPLALWLDLRASTLVLVVFHLLAALLLSRPLARDLGAGSAALFLAVFWLSPWRLYHSGFLWEASYVVLPAAVHLVACRALSERPRAGASFALGATLMLTAQLHGSVLVLLLATAWLLWRRRMRLRWWAAAAGLAAGAVTLVPTLVALIGRLPLPAETDAVAGLGVRLNSLQKAFVYWFRLGSLDVGRRYRETALCGDTGGADPRPLLCGLSRLTEVLALASVALALAAGWWLWRRYRAAEGSAALTGFYRPYVFAMLAASLAAALLSPVLIQGWHLLIALPAACLPVALWIRHAWPRARPWLRAAIAVFLLWRLPAALVLGLGHPMYVTPDDPRTPPHLLPRELEPLAPGLERRLRSSRRAHKPDPLHPVSPSDTHTRTSIGGPE